MLAWRQYLALGIAVDSAKAGVAEPRAASWRGSPPSGHGKLYAAPTRERYGDNSGVLIDRAYADAGFRSYLGDAGARATEPA